MKYEQALTYLESMNSLGIVLGLENCRELCKRLGNPQKDLSFIHVAGTNGKGSIVAYLSTVLKKAGYKTGRYISPVIRDYRERIQVNGRMITKKAVGELVEQIKMVADEMVGEGLPHPTVFEMETAMAFLYFKQMQCQIVVLETGLGGVEDATNIIENPLAVVFASVSMDHMGILGKSLKCIAEKKAGIIKNGTYVVTGIQKPEVMEVFREQSSLKKCKLVLADFESIKKERKEITKQKFDYKNYKNLEIHLLGEHQIQNCVTAIEVLNIIGKCGFEISEKQLREGLKETEWGGRFTVIQKNPLFIMDGAHNEDAAKKLAETIRFYFTNKRIIYIIGVLKDKEYEKILEETCSLAEHVITITPPDNPRALPAIELAKMASAYHSQVTTADSVEEALEIASLLANKEDVVIAFGSLSYLGKLQDVMEKKKGVKR